MKLSSLTCFWVISIQKNFVTATFFTLKLKLPVYQIPSLKVTRLKTDVEFVTKVTIPVCVKYFKAKDSPKITRKLKETGNLARVKDLTKSTSDYQESFILSWIESAAQMSMEVKEVQSVSKARGPSPHHMWLLQIRQETFQHPEWGGILWQKREFRRRWSYLSTSFASLSFHLRNLVYHGTWVGSLRCRKLVMKDVQQAAWLYV